MESWIGRVFHYIITLMTPEVTITVVGAGTVTVAEPGVTVTVPGVDEMYPSQNEEAVWGSRVDTRIARRQLSKIQLVIGANLVGPKDI
jgi:hypothetical protein